MASKKQAVLLIHGIGEQRPMDTLRGFVDTVWTTDAGVHKQGAGNASWSKPDPVSESFELRRLTTVRNANEVRTDFFEFYWAHLMHGTTYGHLWGWMRSLLWRNPKTVPRHLVSVYLVLLVMVALGVALAVYSAIAAVSDKPGSIPAWVSSLLSLAVVPVIGAILLGVVGDAARYLHVAPTNIQRRHEIRQAGVKLLAALHARGYERIIVVGHSLGSVIGYDILNHAWAATHEKYKMGKGANAALDKLEQAILRPTKDDNPQTVRQDQRNYVRELQANGNPWRVTDFITLGSPLAHAAVLMAKDHDDLLRKQHDREFPTSPAYAETSKEEGKPVMRFTFCPERPPGNTLRVSHHAAVFAATRWTNLFFPCTAIVIGDVIGGKLAPWFGPGVKDVEVKTTLRGGLLSHTLYWTREEGPNEAPHIVALRDALNLLDR